MQIQTKTRRLKFFYQDKNLCTSLKFVYKTSIWFKKPPSQIHKDYSREVQLHPNLAGQTLATTETGHLGIMIPQRCSTPLHLARYQTYLGNLISTQGAFSGHP